jgi:hypothetical protein
MAPDFVKCLPEIHSGRIESINAAVFLSINRFAAGVVYSWR